MKASTQQVIAGLLDYASADIVSGIQDATTKIVLSAVIGRARRDPAPLTALLVGNPLGQLLLQPDSDGSIDLDAALDVVAESMRQYGKITIVIPGGKWVSREDKVLAFSADDIGKLKTHIERCANGHA